MTTISIAVTIEVDGSVVHADAQTTSNATQILTGVRDVVLGALSVADESVEPMPEPTPLPTPDADSEILVEQFGDLYHWTCWHGGDYCSASERGWHLPERARIAGGFHTAEKHGGKK